MPDLTLGPMRVQGAAATLAKAAEKLGIHPPDPGLPKTADKRRECHMRSLSACQNEPHCSDAGECVLYVAIVARKGVPVPPSEAKTMTVLWWEYGDGSGCGPVRVYAEASRAEQDMALLRDEHSGKLYRLDPVPLI